ncbi:MAG: hypothetical protein SWQ30_10055 [Thermodesulfobacteriota bacterium]|nr:hypothetical protein [Thermodesulfobacteriota bacterium]
MEETRIEKIRSACDLAGVPGLANKYIEAGFTAEQATQDLLERKRNRDVMVKSAKKLAQEKRQPQ